MDSELLKQKLIDHGVEEGDLTNQRIERINDQLIKLAGKSFAAYNNYDITKMNRKDRRAFKKKNRK